jgi:hypothetical protein
MKNQLLIFVSILFYSSAFSQALITDADVTWKKGIYRNFEEFKFNNPSLELTYTVLENKESYGFFGTGGDCIYYTFTIEKDESKSIGSIYGFCDGRLIYINTNELEKLHKAKFTLLQNVGLYSYYDHIIENYSGGAMSPGGQFNGGGTSKSLETTIIDINNGNKITLNNRSLKNILKDDNALYTEYMNLEEKNIYMYKYLILYSSKHHSDRIINREKELIQNDANNYLLISENDTINDIYYNRIIRRFKYNSAFNSVNLEECFYRNKNKKMEGIVARNKFNPMGFDYDYPPNRIGLWRFYYKTGKLKQELVYDIMGNQIFKRDFDENGEIKLKK